MKHPSAVLALAWANIFAQSYNRVVPPVRFAVNDVGMALFFGLAAKEIVEATRPGGSLHTWRRASLPVVAAAGGMIAPALSYVGFVRAAGGEPFLRGWAIPCATDIAFSYWTAQFVLGERHPGIPFLLLLAIADDAFGLVILALFYPVRDLHLPVAAGLMSLAIAITFAQR